MKRESLFRVYDIYKKKYLPEDVYVITNRTDFGSFGFMTKDWEDYKEGEYFYDDAQILEQSTGLTDKNGTKIFEGDIIQWQYCDFSEYLKSQVTFCDGSFTIPKDNDGDIVTCEVIGNTIDVYGLLNG